MFSALRIQRSKIVSTALIVGLILLLVILLPGATQIAAGQQDGFHAAWQHANQAASYRFTAHIAQTYMPRATTSMIGQQNQSVNLDMDGEVQLPDRSSVNLRLTSQLGNPAPVTVIHDGSRSFIQKGDQLEPATDSTNLAVPTSPASFVDYAAAATNVHQTSDAANPRLTHYVFDLDPTLLVHQLLARIAPGDAIRPIMPPAYLHLTGTGEVWVDADGLPQRQIIHLNLPQTTAEYDAQVDLTLNTSDWNRVPPLPVPLQNSQGVWQLQPGADAPAANSTPIVPPLSPETRQGVIILIGFMLIAIVFGLWYVRQRKAATIFLIVLICFALTFATPLQLLAQSIGNAAPQSSITAALGLTSSTPSAQQKSVDQLVQNFNRTVQSPASTIGKCGDGVAGVDTDKDGLTDQQERCLGTNPYSKDTDNDGVSDYNEVMGFDCNGKHWTTDPLNPDSNHDGILDGEQWPDPANISGTCDPKGNGAPNVWNGDNDKDGVPNAIDLSPQTATPYSTTFNLHINYGSPVTDTTYVEIEVRPQNPVHLRYSVTALDWPNNDNEGQIQDLDNSQKDVHLIPALEIQTNISNTTWISQFNYIVRPLPNNSVGALLYVPLTPVSDGGLNQAFYGKVAYAAGELAQQPWLEWSARLVWMVEDQNDSSICDTSITTVGGPTTYSDCRYDKTTPQVVHVYRDESFSVTGLSITRSRGFESLVFGTPQYPTEDNYLFQTAFSLSDIFLNYQQVQTQTHASALQEIAYRFSQPATPSGLRFNLPNTVTVAMSDTVSAHLDQGLSTLNDTVIPQFLERYYAASGQNCADAKGSFTCAALGLATEYTLASHDLSELQPSLSGQLYVASLTDMHFVTQRNVKALMYERSASGQWSAETLSRELEIIGQRYATQIAALTAQNSSVSAVDLRAGAFLPYSLMWPGLDAIEGIDTEKFLELTPEDEQRILAAEITEPFWIESKEIIESGAKLYQLFHPEYDYQGVPPNKLGAAVSRVSEKFEANGSRLGKILVGASLGLQVALLASEIANTVCKEKQNEDCQQAFEVIEPTIRGALVLTAAAQVVKAFGEINFINLGYINTLKAEIGTKKGIAAVVGTAISIGLDWTVFGLIASTNQGGYGYVPTFKAALAYAIVSTIWSLAVLAISFIPVVGEIISTILQLGDTILLLATGGRYNLAKVITGLFYDTELETGLDLGHTQFQTVRTVYLTPDRVHLGDAVSGNIFHLDQWFTGVITTTGTGTRTDLDQSSTHGYFTDVHSDPGGEGEAHNTPAQCTTVASPYNENSVAASCFNQLTAEFPLTAAINAQLKFTNLIELTYRYRETAAWGLGTYDYKTDTVTLPSDEKDRHPTTLYMDILPDTLDGLWNWSALTNPDSDGDGFTDAQEINGFVVTSTLGITSTVSTDPHNPDTDGDGLSDYFEINNSHTNPLVADTDGDGLSDGFEVRIGSNPLNPDSDGDGLKDGEEVFHFDGTNWVGGWNVTLPGNLTVHVFSDPMNADADGDGVLDSGERDNHLSPTAFNASSHLAMTVNPLAANPGSAWQGAAAAPGGSISFTVSLSADALAITNTLKECVPAFLTGISINTIGDHTPTTQSIACSNGTGFAWNFGGANTLQVGQKFTATVSAQVLPTIVSSIGGAASALLTTTAMVLSDTARVLIDADNPLVGFTAPLNGSILKRDPGGTTYIVGGVASDPTSWISDTQVNVGPGFVAATDTNVWSYAWNLPADGTYTLQARAHDHVGHTSSLASVSVTVDGTPPTGTLTAANGMYLRPTLSNTIQLSGTASDNLAGISAVQISINHAAWQNVYYTTTKILSTNWSYTWTLPDTDNSGAYSLDARFIDRAGNESTIISKRVIVDALPPASDLTTNAYLGTPYVRAGQPITVVGRANDLGYAPVPARPATLTGTLNSLSSATAWLQYSKITDDDQGVRMTWLGDINGDARADLAIGLPNSNNGAGQVALINGRGGNWPTPPNTEDIFNSDTSFVGAPGAGLGALVSSAGDVNGDGFYDTLIGDPANQRVFLVFGNGQPLGRDLPLTGTVESAMWTVLNVNGLGTLHGVASAGDVNGDGQADLLIVMDKGGGAYWTYLVLGHAAPWYPAINVGTEAAAIAHSGGDVFATGVGDVNGDHIDDFVVNSQNTVWLFAGRTSFTAGQAQSLDGWAFTAFGSSDPHVTVAPLGDINGDGLSDFIFNNGSTPDLVLGRSSGGWGVSRNLSGYPLTLSGFLAAPGDVNGDGFNDLLIGASGNNAYLLAGASNLSAVAPSIMVTLTGVAGAASAPYAAGADLNCDQSSDLLLLPAQTPVVTPLLATAPIFEAVPFVPIDQLPVAQTPDGSSSPNGQTLQPNKISAAPAIAYVSAAYCASCANDGRTWNVDAFSSIQAAIDSGTSSVFISPGVYNEAFHLVNNVTVAGSSAETTIVQPPTAGGASYLVTTDGVQSATLRNLSLVGNSTTNGIHAGSGTTNLQIARNIIRYAPNAIVLNGSTTQVEIVNNTIVKNTNGISANASAGVDVRNSIFAYNTGTAVSYQSAAPTKLRLYNDYFGNGTDLRIDGVGQAASGPGEIAIDPLFADVNANNYRPLSGSSVIDAGNPSDPTPPATGGRIDMGYAENGHAAFYASVNYCATCDNDGLIWQWDAFNTIQAALDAAGNYLKSIGCVDATQSDQQGFCNTHVTVGVGAGTYVENVSVPSHVYLTGAGADSTTIDGSNGTGVAVTFNNVVDAQVSGFKFAAYFAPNQSANIVITNTASLVTVTRNLFTTNNLYGPNILVGQGASGSVLFNTLGADADYGILADGANTWVNARDNIIVNTQIGALVATSGAQILSDYNYLGSSSSPNYSSVATGEHDITDTLGYPYIGLFVSCCGFDGDFTLMPGSLAVDTADPSAPVPANGGANADMGYKELTATPLVLMFGKLGSNACYLGNSGVKQVDVGMVPIADATSSITATAPSSWTTATLQTPGQTASYWTQVITPTTGLARLYSRATDQVGNVEQPVYDRSTQKFNLYDGAFIGDAVTPIVTLTQPANNTVTTTAAIELIGQVSDYISNTFTVADKYFVVNGAQRITADWLDTGWNGSGPRTFRAATILASGTYTVQAQAVDLAGNVGKSAVSNLTLNVPVLAQAPDTSNHVVSFISPANATWTNKTTLHVIGAALYTAVSGSDRITLTVNGGAAQPVTVANPAALSTMWTADVPLLISSTNTLSARAFNNLGAGAATNLLVSVDTFSPSLTVPASGLVVTQSAKFTGTASDANSGLAAVEVSVNGGYRWMTAAISGTTWSLTWNAPANNQNTSYTVLVRARDRAGNVTLKSFVAVVDNTPPTGFNPIDFSIPIGSYLHSAQTLVMTWTLPTDAGGPVTTTGVIDQISKTLPVTLLGGNTLNKSLNGDGQWFAHLSAADRAGNRLVADYGPWYVNISQFCASPLRNITIDGNINTTSGEWLRNEFMDDDERPTFNGSPVVRDRQELYVTWDANAFYLGWRGAWWNTDGTLFAYLASGGSGTTQLVTPTASSHVLPFAADYAVAITGPTQGTFYHFNGSTWQVQPGMTFAQSGLGDTEVRMPLAVSSLSDVRLIAFATSDQGAVWSIFPTSNALSGPWTDAYRWQPICSATAPNLNQPRGINVLTDMTSPQSSNVPYAPLTALQYVVSLNNQEASAVSNVVVTLTASAGLTYQSVISPAGTICNTCTVGGTQWRLTLPSIPINTTRLITFTGKLAANLSAIPIVTSTLTAKAGSANLGSAALSNLTDGVPPTVTVMSAVPATLKVGSNSVSGLADDGTGIGVKKVEILPQGGSWQTVTGTQLWQGNVNVPNVAQFTVQVRATDFYTQVSNIQTFTFTVDNVGPTVSMTLPQYITSTLAQIGGTTSDAAGLVDKVEVQIGSSSALWLAASGPYSPTAGSQGWNFTWSTPISDGVPSQLRARATDMAGNVTIGPWQATTIDTVAPVITTTTYISDIVPNLYTTPARSGPPVLGGIVADGSGINQMWATVYAPDGTAYTDTVSRTNNSWSYIPYLHNGTGRFVVSIAAVDQAGNTQVSALYALTPLCTSLIVQNANDSGAGSLRNSIACANPTDTIPFNSSLAGQTITLTSGALVVSVPITVDGSAAAGVRISGNNATRIFSATAPLTLKALTLQNGQASGDGGGLNTTSALTLTNVNVFSSTATGNGAGVAATGAIIINGGVFRNNLTPGFGGGLYANTTLNVINTQFISNTSKMGGGLHGIGTTALTNTQFISNTTSGYGGGGARIDGPATVTGGVFQSNRAQLEGGGLLMFGSLNLTGTQFISNTANGVGNVGGGGLVAYGAATITSGLFQSNATPKLGGGLYAASVTVLTNTTFISNTANHGGGLYNAGTVLIAGTTFISNTANGGGGLYNAGTVLIAGTTFSSNTANGGGGIESSGSAVISNTTFANNVVDNGAGLGTGGGFQLNSSSGTASLTNVTFNGNQAKGASDDGGGGIMVYGGSITLTNATLSGNSTASGAGGGGISVYPTGTITVSLVNTLVAGNTSAANKPDLSGAYLSATHNLIGSVDGSTGITNGVNGNIAGTNAAPVNALLGPLANNGGSTWTQALLSGSPAINAANDATCPATDQRGVHRPQGAHCDIGAYEAAGSLVYLPLILR